MNRNFWRSLALAFSLLTVFTSAKAQLFSTRYPGMTVNGNLQDEQKRDTLRYRFNMVIMPLSFFGQGLELGSEFRLDRKTSLRLGAGYFLGTKPGFYSNVDDFSGWRGEAQLRFFITDPSIVRHTLYLGPFFQVKHIDLNQSKVDNSNPWVPIKTKVKTSVTAPSFGVLIGYQELIPGGFFVDFFLGGGLVIPNDVNAAQEAHIGFVNPYNKGVMVRGGLGLGLFR